MKSITNDLIHTITLFYLSLMMYAVVLTGVVVLQLNIIISALTLLLTMTYGYIKFKKYKSLN